MNRSPCKGCKKEVIWCDLPSGGKICLDPVAPVYVVTGHGAAIRAANYYVSHFATCPDASQFKKAPAVPAEPDQGRLL